MKYDFDRVIDRSGSYSIKYEPTWRAKPEDVLPLWVADMDFAAPPCVLEALARRVEHGIFGYSEPDGKYFLTLRKWFEERFGWSVEREWTTVTPGVVNALYVAIRALTKPGGGVVIQQPVYYPFSSAVKKTGREPLINELVLKDGTYEIDFDDFEEKIKRAELFILCNPHNPVGRVWTREELTRMGEICLRRKVKVVADEIHQDFVFAGHKHTVFASMDKDLSAITLTCTSPSKTFNLAGLLHANIFISDKSLREKFNEEYSLAGIGQPGVMGLVSCEAAYAGGAEWLEELLPYLARNISFLKTYLARNLSEIKLIEPQGTYLAWLDFRASGISPQKLDETITRKAKLWLNAGLSFGAGGAGFERMNVACPLSVLRGALGRLESVDWKNLS